MFTQSIILEWNWYVKSLWFFKSVPHTKIIKKYYFQDSPPKNHPNTNAQSLVTSQQQLVLSDTCGIHSVAESNVWPPATHSPCVVWRWFDLPLTYELSYVEYRTGVLNTMLEFIFKSLLYSSGQHYRLRFDHIMAYVKYALYSLITNSRNTRK